MPRHRSEPRTNTPGMTMDQVVALGVITNITAGRGLEALIEFSLACQAEHLTENCGPYLSRERNQREQSDAGQQDTFSIPCKGLCHSPVASNSH
jgi:hypothetical protein